jgi:hypothetical protein
MTGHGIVLSRDGSYVSSTYHLIVLRTGSPPAAMSQSTALPEANTAALASALIAGAHPRRAGAKRRS